MGRRTEPRLVDDARGFAVLVYRNTEGFPEPESYGLTSQMRRAAVSIGSNISEGAYRRSDADFARFVAIAEGSAAELSFQIDLSLDLGFLDLPAASILQSRLRSLRRRMDALHRSLVRNPHRGHTGPSHEHDHP